MKLNFKAASWTKVLKRVARHGGMELVLKATPPGTNPGLKGQNQGAVIGPDRSAMLDSQNYEAPEIRVQPF